MEPVSYQGIRYPDRAEAIADFKGYRVFLDHWDPVSADLSDMFEGVSLRGETRALGIYGAQGAGKTLLAEKLLQDIQVTQGILREGQISYDPNNLWHRITGGAASDIELIRRASDATECILVENVNDWISQVEQKLGQRRDRRCIVIADNAETSYFRGGLSGLTYSEYLSIEDASRLNTSIAQRFVRLCRTSLRRCVFIILTNDDKFLEAFGEAVDQQHMGLLLRRPLQIPTAQEKETIVRINTNRLNAISYWYCLDKAGPNEKRAVRSALAGATTFPDSFKAVNTAIRTASTTRLGRPAKKNMLSLIVFTNAESVSSPATQLGEIAEIEFQHLWASSCRYKAKWALPVLKKERESGLLESEWMLRVVLLGNPFLRSLLSQRSAGNKPASQMIEALKVAYSPGVQRRTKERNLLSTKHLMDHWVEDGSVDIQSFWAKGQARAWDYEPALKSILPEYNRLAPGFLSYRPDATIERFRPCSILDAINDKTPSINAAIRRTAHVFEFAALKNAQPSKIQGYLETKLANYVEVTQEQ